MLDGLAVTLSFGLRLYFPCYEQRGRLTPDRVFCNAADKRFGWPSLSIRERFAMLVAWAMGGPF